MLLLKKITVRFVDCNLSTSSWENLKKKIKHRAHALNPGALKMLGVITFNLFIPFVGFDLQ